MATERGPSVDDQPLSIALLKRLEWSGTRNGFKTYCPICWGHPTRGHHPRCDLNFVLVWSGAGEAVQPISGRHGEQR